MKRCLIVANQTIGGEALTAAVQDRIADGTTEFVLVVPAVPTAASVSAVRSTQQRSSSVGVQNGSKLAAQRLATGLDWIHELGAIAHGEVVLDDTATAVAQTVLSDPPDEVIVSTLPRALSKFLRQDLASKIRRSVDVPVTVVTATS